MRKFKITDVSLEHQYFDITFEGTDTWTYRFDSLSNDEFQVVFYNMYGIIKTLGNNDDVIKKLNRFHEDDHNGIIIELCIRAFKKRPTVIMDFDKFTEFIVEKYSENFRYFTEIESKIGLLYSDYSDAILMAEERTEEQLNDILETIEEE